MPVLKRVVITFVLLLVMSIARGGVAQAAYDAGTAAEMSDGPTFIQCYYEVLNTQAVDYQTIYGDQAASCSAPIQSFVINLVLYWYSDGGSWQQISSDPAICSDASSCIAIIYQSGLRSPGDYKMCAEITFYGPPGYFPSPTSYGMNGTRCHFVSLFP
jgi:hypothetical protein